MTANPAVRNLVREGKTFELHNVMQLSASEGMQTLDQALADLVKRNIITLEEATMKSSNPAKLNSLLQFQNEASKV